MNRLWLVVIWASVGVTGWVELLAQDRNFSVQYAHPLLFSPSMAGLVEGTLRANASHSIRRVSRNETFNTSLFSVDKPLNTRLFTGGVGAMFMNELGSGIQTNSYQLSFAYDIPMGAKIRYDNFRAGFQVGLLQRSLVQPDLYYEDQFNGVNFNNPTQEAFNNLTVVKPDLSVSVLWYRTQKIVGNPEFNPFLGTSIQHITQPNIGFYDERGERVSMRYTVYGGGRFRTRIPLDFNLSMLAMFQNNSNTFSVNFYTRYMLYEGGESFGFENFGFSLGANYVHNHLVEPYIGVQWKKTYALNVAYEVLTNTNSIIDSNYGGIHFTLSYTMGYLKYDRSALPFPIY
jgi:type IX secretion system PorP/SprF family membrane protein